MGKSKLEVISAAMAQVEAIRRGERASPTTTVRVCGDCLIAPDGLADELSAIIGRAVIVSWRNVSPGSRTNNTQEITDGIARYYEDAARRGARSGD